MLDAEATAVASVATARITVSFAPTAKVLSNLVPVILVTVVLKKLTFFGVKVTLVDATLIVATPEVPSARTRISSSPEAGTAKVNERP